MQTIHISDTIDYHEPCPYCGAGALYLEFDEADQGGAPTEAGTHVHCKFEKEDDPRDHCTMPYVHWLPIQTRAAAWAAKNVQIVWEDERQKLADWNAGKPMPGGMRNV